MKLVASAIVRNEVGRYLRPWLDHLLDFCDAVAILDDGSTDGTYEYLQSRAATSKIYITGSAHGAFDEHEGRARQRLLDWTLAGDPPTHVLAIDADEFISDGQALRDSLTETNVRGARRVRPPLAVAPIMEEVWEINGDCLCTRQDGGWRSHHVTMAWAVPARTDGLKIARADRQLACGRVPEVAGRREWEISTLHFGWANPEHRQARYDRYMAIDGGRFHTRAHLESIKQPPTLEGRPWPEALLPYRAAIMEAAGVDRREVLGATEWTEEKWEALDDADA